MIYFSIDRRSRDGALQLSINDDNTGYRIAGPKYDGNGQSLIRHELTPNDVDEIRSYLNKVSRS
jgi:hypothetical protein